MSNFTLRTIRQDRIRHWWENLDRDEYTYDNFVLCVNRCIDEAIRGMEDNIIKRIADGEDRLTEELKTILRCKNLFDTVEHDAQTGGHTDLVVRWEEYSWKAETKIFGGRHSYGNDWLEKGFTALTENYSRGTPYDSHGCLIIYVKHPNTTSVMCKWMTHIWEKMPDTRPLVFERCTLNKLGFISKHIHLHSGQEYIVRHIPVGLYDATKQLRHH